MKADYEIRGPYCSVTTCLAVAIGTPCFTNESFEIPSPHLSLASAT